MTLDLVQTMAQRNGISSLPKIDPNTQDISENAEGHADKLLQAAISAVLVGLYKYSRIEQQAANILSNVFFHHWQEEVFGIKREEFVSNVASYSGVYREEAVVKLDDVFSGAIAVIRENATDPTGSFIKHLFTQQRKNILLHLPAAIGMGEALEDNSLDDRTNKMEGPVSNIIHNIEKAFAGTEKSVKKE